MYDTETIAVQFKQKKKYKCCEFKENIQPMAVWESCKLPMERNYSLQTVKYTN